MTNPVTNAQLAQLVNDALTKWNAREAEQFAWVSGSATGGPNSDGRYPLSNGSGTTALIDSPAKLADLLNGPAATAVTAKNLALTYRDAAEAAAISAGNDKGLANNHRLAAQDHKDLAKLYRDEIAAMVPGFNATAAQVNAKALEVSDNTTLVEAIINETFVLRDDAMAAKVAAEAAAALAATFNPNDYYTKTAADARYLQSTNFTWTNLSGKPSTFTPSAHTHVISEVTGLQTALDGKQPTGNYSLVGHGHVIADVSGLQTALDGKQAAGSYVTTTNFTWANLSGKPTTFTPSAHVHAITDVTGLQTALDGKQAAGNYSLAGHTHVIADVTGLQTALDGKQAAGSYVTTANFTWANLSDKPTTFTPSAHTHVISDVTGLQTALDGKQAAGSYAASVHSHAIGDVTGLSTALTSKVTRRTGEVSLGVQTYGVSAWTIDGVTGAGIGGWARHFSIKGAELDSHAGFFSVFGTNTQAAEVRIGVGNADSGYTQNNALRITSSELSWNGATVWHGGNFSPASKSDVGHTHVISDVTGLQTALDGKQSAGSYVTTTNFTWANLSGKPTTFTPSAHTHVISDVTGLQTALDGKQAAGSYAPAIHVHDYLPLSGGIVGGTLEAGDFLVKYSSAATWASRIAAPWEQPAEVLNMNENGFSAITFHVVNKYANLFGYDENNVLKTNNSIIWHSGNFNPDGKADLSHAHSIAHVAGLQAALDGKQANLGYTPLNNAGGAMYGTLSLFDAPIILANNGSLPYMDLQTTGVSGGRNYRIRSGIEGVSNGGFSIRDLTSGTNVLSIDGSGNVSMSASLNVTGTAGANSFGGFYFGQYLSEKTTIDGDAVLQYGLSALGNGKVYLSGYYGVNLMTGAASRLAIDGAGNVSIPVGLSVSGSPVFPSRWTDDFQTFSDFVDGTLVETDIPANVENGESFEIEITGKSYSASQPPFKVIAQGYIYANTFLSASGISYGGQFADSIKVMERNGVLCFWWPRISYWNSFRVRVVTSINPSNGTIARNRVTDVINSVEPSVSKKVTITLEKSIRATTTGRVGIGTDNPAEMLHIQRNTGTSGFENGITLTNGVDANLFSYVTGSAATDKRALITAGAASQSLAFGTAYTERMRITPAGELLVGRSSASGLGKLNVDGGADFTGGNVLLCRDTGNVGVGTAGPGNRLHVLESASQTVARFESTLGSSFISLHTGSAQTFLGSDSAGALLVQTPGSGYSTKLFVGATGNVGIGTTGPALPLVVSNGGAGGLEFNHSGGIGNGTYIQSYNRATGDYIHNTNYAIGHTWYTGGTRAADLVGGSLGIGVTSPVTSLDTAGDITARGGNLFIRENPGGAGVGMRLHHNGGGAYIDFDGALNFRTGDGNLHASISDGEILANQLRALGSVSAVGFGTGSANITAGTTSNPGYLYWNTPDGVRRGYMGWAEGTNIVYQAENGWGLKFNSQVILGGSTFRGDGQANFHGTVNQFLSYGNPQTDSGPSLQAYAGNTSSGAWMSFHRPGIWAINMGLDSSNVFRIGGWSAGNIFALDMAGNLTLTGGLTAAGLGITGTAAINGAATFGSTVDISSGNLRINSGGGDSAMGAYISYRNNLGAERGWVGYGEGSSRMRVYNGIGDILIQGSGTTINSYGGGNVRLSTNSGHLDVGPLNSSYCHFGTDRPAFYFGQRVEFQDTPLRYQQGAFLHHSSTSLGSGAITVSTASPSGGSDGDIWIKVAS